MRKNSNAQNHHDVIARNMALVSKIYESFEALEETLGKLKMEEPLFITYVAKKTFAKSIFPHAKNSMILMKKHIADLNPNNTKSVN